MSVVLKRKFIIEHHKKGMRPPEIFKLGKKLKINRMMIKRTIDRNIDDLKRKLTKCWDEISLDVVRAAVAAFPKRLRNVVKALGKHFE